MNATQTGPHGTERSAADAAHTASPGTHRPPHASQVPQLPRTDGAPGDHPPNGDPYGGDPHGGTPYGTGPYGNAPRASADPGAGADPRPGGDPRIGWSADT
ncbi:hypothetical protein ACVNF4_34655, partial [Streptomyces sp. S6]